MKKKLVLLVATSLSTVLAVSSLLFVGKKANKFEFARGSGEPVAFSVDYTSIQPIGGEDNAYSVDLVNGKGARVGTRIKNVEMTETGFKPASADGSFYFYNVDPIRGISTSAFYVNGPQYGSYTFFGDAFLSKNAIDIDDVLDSKYADLKYQSFYCVCNGMYAMEGDNSNMPGLNECRYFFMNIACDNPDFRFLGMEFESVCQDEIYPDPVGENYGVLSAEQKATVSYLFGNSFSLDQTGNGAWGITYCYSARHTENGVGIAQCVESGEKSEIVTAIEDCGYSHTYSEMGQDFYQKQEGGVTHTVLATKYEYTLFDKYEFYYTDEYPFIDTRTSWPSDILEANFTAAHCAEILVVENELVDSYQYETQSHNTMSIVYIVVNLVDTVTQEQAAALLDTINTYYSTGNWHYSEIEDRYHNDPVFSVLVDSENEGKVITLRFIEDNPTIDPPSASDIAAALKISALQVPAITGNANSRYSVQSESGSAYFIYYIYYQTSTDLENVKTFLVNSGFTPDGSMDMPYPMAQYRKQVDEGTTYRINLSLIEGAIYVVHYVSRTYSIFTDIKEAFNYQFRIQSSMLNLLFDGVTISGSFDYVCSYSNNKVVAKNAAGSSLVSEITSSAVLNYVAPFDGYAWSGPDYLFTFEESGDDIIIQCTNQRVPTFYTYEVFNQAVANFFGDSNPDSLILFEEGDNLIQGFEDPIYTPQQLTYFAPESEVRRVYSLYTNRLLEAGFVYSNYLGKYINTTNNYAYQVEIRESYGIYSLAIRVSYDSFLDFESYNALNIGSYEVYTYFPDLISSSDYNKKMFISPSSGAEYFSVDISLEFDIDSYVSLLESDGYEELENNGYHYLYSKISGDSVYRFEAYGFNRGYYLYFNRYSGFGSAAQLLASITNDDAKDYLISMGFSECFTSEGIAYRLENAGNNVVTFSALNEDEISDYRNYLLSHGFSANKFGTTYYKDINGNNTVFDVINIDQRGLYYQVDIYRQSFNFTTWSSALERLENADHPYHSISNYIPYPDDAVGNSYSIEYVDHNDLQLKIRRDYDIGSYIALLSSLSGRDYKDIETDFYFPLEHGSVSVRVYETYIVVEIHCYDDFIDIPTSTPLLSIGTTPITLQNDYQFFEFTPSEDGNYSFTTDGDGIDSYGVLCEEGGLVLENDDDSGEGNNFKIEEYLESGVTYYIGVRNYYSSGTPEVNLIVSKI